MGRYEFYLFGGLFILAIVSFSFLSRHAASHFDRRRHYRLHFWLMVPFASYLVLDGTYDFVVTRRLSALGAALLGLMLGFIAFLHGFVRGPLERNLVQSLGPHHCAGCGYDLKGNVSGTCPECGARLLGGSQTPPDARP